MSSRQDLRERLAEMLATPGPLPGARAYSKADAVLAIRDEELADAKSALLDVENVIRRWRQGEFIDDTEAMHAIAQTVEAR